MVYEAERVILAAGSMGSTELLLRCRDVSKTLPSLSPFLGKHWSSNGDFLTPAMYLDRALWPDRGVTIGAVIDYLDALRESRSVTSDARWKARACGSR